ncbi:hypothetical protein [Haloarchaeobius sp. DT45]|uniref:hypothetical protein n=1 Tax=Haloarchaeobius sp. DT45 TaxID=3446116 RepID=UPI003F6B1157
MKPTLLLICLLVVTAMTTNAGGLQGGPERNILENDTIERSLVSHNGVEYKIWFYPNNNTIETLAENNKDRKLMSGLFIYVDRTIVVNSNFNISSGESIKNKYNMNGYLAGDVDKHTFEVSTTEDYERFNYTLNISSQNPNGIELPEIENVEVDTATIDGEETTVARVTIQNEGQVQYLTTVRVTSLQTHSDPYEARVPMDGSRRTLVIPLNEGPDMKVAGEVRLFTGWIHNHSDIEDQVEFVGTVDGETEVWDRQYEPIMVEYWDVPEDEVYQYENESVKQQNDAIWRERLEPVAAAAAALLVGFVVLVSLLSRFRS